MNHTKASDLPYTLSAYNAAGNNLWQDLFYDAATAGNFVTITQDLLFNWRIAGTGLEPHTLI